MNLKDFKDRMTSLQSITGVVGPDNVYVARLPQHNKADRYVLLRKIGGSPQYSLTGEYGQGRTMIEVVCYAKEPNAYHKVTELVDAVRNAFSGFHGGLIGDTFVESCQLETEPIETYEDADDGSDDGFSIVNMTFSIWHTRTIPTLN